MRRVGLGLLAGVLALSGAPASAAETAPKVGARAAAVLDTRSGRILYGLRADERLAPASLAKMVTALVVADALAPNDTVTISRAAAFAEADAVRWPERAVFRVDDVLHGLLLESSNGAAIALAERVAASTGAFATLMNRKAAEVGARTSRFVTPNGLDAPGQYSTARDVAHIAAALLRDRWLASVDAALTRQIRWPDGRIITLHNRNRFMLRYPGAVGVKNGYTTEAGNAVAAAATRNGVTLVAVALNGPDVYDDAARLMNWGFRAAPPAVPGTAARPGPGSVSASAPAPAPAESAPPAKRGGSGKWLVALLMLSYVGRVAWVRSKVRRRRRRMRALAARRVTPLRPRAARRA